MNAESPADTLPSVIVKFHENMPIASGDDLQFLRHALRTLPGSTVIATDGVRVAECIFEDVLEPHNAPRALAAVETRHLFWPVSPGERPDWIVQKATELGIERLSLYFADKRPSWWDDDRLNRMARRLNSVVRHTVMYQRSLRVPALSIGIDDAVVRELSVEDTVFVSNRGDAALTQCGPQRQHVVLPEEISGLECEIRHRGGRLSSISANPVRAETAAVAAAVLLAICGRA